MDPNEYSYKRGRTEQKAIILCDANRECHSCLFFFASLVFFVSKTNISTRHIGRLAGPNVSGLWPMHHSMFRFAFFLSFLTCSFFSFAIHVHLCMYIISLPLFGFLFGFNKYYLFDFILVLADPRWILYMKPIGAYD